MSSENRLHNIGCPNVLEHKDSIWYVVDIPDKEIELVQNRIDLVKNKLYLDLPKDLANIVLSYHEIKDSLLSVRNKKQNLYMTKQNLYEYQDLGFYKSKSKYCFVHLKILYSTYLKILNSKKDTINNPGITSFLSHKVNHNHQYNRAYDICFIISKSEPKKVVNKTICLQDYRRPGHCEYENQNVEDTSDDDTD